MNMEKTKSKPTLHIFLIIFCVLLWFIGFTYYTGFGMGYDIFGKAKLMVFAFSLYLVIFKNKRYNFNTEGIFTIFVIACMIFVNYARNDVSISDYIWVWLLIPIIKLFDVQKSQLKLIGLAYGIAAFGILLIGNVTDVFENWDGNSVSMVQFFAYTIFMASLADTKEKKNIWIISIFSAMYLYLLNTFESRSAQLFSIVMLLCMLSVIPLRKCFGKAFIVIALLAPLIIAVFIASINDLPIVESINNWSVDTFNKPIFNGRDTLWEMGFKDWLTSPFIGNGNLSYSNYHNSAIATLVGAGGIGYVILITVCYKILSRSLKWINDSIVYGLATAFLIIWMQQSVELGLVAEKPNVIPYMILGLLYARINTLESGKDDESIHNNTDL